MLIEAVTAHAFGPFAEKRLSLAPGLTVIFGHNESGKSTWHAALYAAVCGIRRARGAGRKEDRDFADRHKPWNFDSWEVSALVKLNDGRRIELHQDLDGRVDCRATDAILGRDVSAEIMLEGTPDASRWLGLDRHSFLAIACVRQADLLAVLDDPDLLQEHLQRAAATAGTDATATAAISCIEEFSREYVGQDRTHSNKPLRRALVRAETAARELEQAEALHADFLRLMARADGLAALAADAAQRLRVIQAAMSVQESMRLRRRFDRARELSSKYPDGPPSGLVAQDAVAQEVAAAVNSWEGRPAVPSLQGLTVAELQVMVQALPDLPIGDLEPDISVIEMRDAYERAQQAIDLHERNRPPIPIVMDSSGLSEDDLRTLAREMETAAPRVDPTLKQRVNQGKERLETLPKPGTHRNTLVIGAVIATAGLAIAAFAWLVPGLLFASVGIATVIWAATRSGDEARIRALEELRIAEQALGEQEHAANAATTRRSAAIDQARAKRLPLDPVALREFATNVAHANRIRSELQNWTNLQHDLAQEFHSAEVQLKAALRGCGIEANGNALAATKAYETSCAERAQLAAEACKRPGLEAQLIAREAAEVAANEAATRLSEAEEKLRTTTIKCGLDAADDESRAHALKLWQQQRAATLQELERQREEWGELQTLLDNGTLEELGAKATQRLSEAIQLRAQVPSEDLAAVQAAGIENQKIEPLRQEIEEAGNRAAEARGQVEERTRQLANVAEAEETLAFAKTELARVRQLDQTLDLTLKFLRQAEERVHRDISRVLAETIRPWLPTVTANRYNEVVVDPASLAIKVRGSNGQWRNAKWLSHGTAEQVYLLLRVAMAKHLTTPGETCPLILDDVTVQCDRDRKKAVLDLLHAISRERQVILFTQEEEVFEWAEDNLVEPQDQLEHLEVPGEC